MATLADTLLQQKREAIARRGSCASRVPRLSYGEATAITGWWLAQAGRYKDWSADGAATCWQCTIGDHLDRMIEAAGPARGFELWGVDTPLPAAYLDQELSCAAAGQLWESALAIALKLDAQSINAGDWNTFSSHLWGEIRGLPGTIGEWAARATVGGAKVAGGASAGFLLGFLRGLGPLGLALVAAGVWYAVRRAG